MTKKYIALSVALCAFACGCKAIPFTNLFNPYDILLFKPQKSPHCFGFDIAYEGAFHSQAFRANPNDRVLEPDLYNEYGEQDIQEAFSRKAPVLDIWQDEQMLNTPTEFGIVNGDLHVPLNLMLTAYLSFPHNVYFGMYLPIYSMQLNNVRWAMAPDSITGQTIDAALNKLEATGRFDLRSDRKRFGIGDLAALVWWIRNYPQAKEWLKNVHIAIRAGFTFPTGKPQDFDLLFALPFGYDAGAGFLAGGNFELGFGRHIRLGIDAEFLNLFGSQKMRRAKVALGETDLTFTTKALTQLDPGFLQHYTIYTTFAHLLNGLSVTGAYQHTRQHESKIFFDSSQYDSRLANGYVRNNMLLSGQESLQDWTAHSIIGMVDYDPCVRSAAVSPRFSLFLKYGFNGKRCISFNTVGCQVSLNF